MIWPLALLTDSDQSDFLLIFQNRLAASGAAAIHQHLSTQ